MAQQINLHSPILLRPRLYFSAWAMAQALAALLLGLLLLAGWASHGTSRLRAELSSTAAAQSAERQRLQSELAQRPAAAKDTAALEQDLAQARLALAARQKLVDELTGPGTDSSRAAVLRLLAQTAPERLWLTEVRLADRHFELAGVTLQPEALRPWLQALMQQPAFAGLALRSVVVEGTEPMAGSAAWSFRVAGHRGDAP